MRALAVFAIGGDALAAADQTGTADEIRANAADMAQSVALLVGGRCAIVTAQPGVGTRIDAVDPVMASAT